MRSALPFATLICLLVALSVILAGMAANAALARDDVDSLDTDLTSLISADYSADGAGAGLGRLDGRIIEAARTDGERLQANASDIEIVPAVRKLPAQTSNGPSGGFGPTGTWRKTCSSRS